jgi:Fe-Mn family superoxide dismutase
MSPEGGGEPEGMLRDRIEADFGSYEGWKAEFVEAAKWPASGWALLTYDPVAKQLRNLAVEKHNDGAFWGSHPVLALDVWEHSYYYQYGPDRGDFVDAFFEVVEWDTVASELAKTTERHEG